MTRLHPVLAADALTKRYGGVTALAGVSLTLHKGAVHTLLGANGAGKSTLVKILSGNVQPDEGSILLHGTPTRLASPGAAFAAGIATVHQELSLFPGLTVAQNILIGRERRNRIGWIDEQASIGKARGLLARLGIDTIEPGAMLGSLSLAEAQLVEIAKAMSLDPRVLILDEPTSSLGRTDVERLLDVVRSLRREGCAIVFISHRMGEIEAITDDVTILRNGRLVTTMTRADFGRELALELMLGETQEELQRLHPAPPATASLPLLDIETLSLPGRLDAVSLSVHPGEVVGLAGLEGQGQKELLFALFGVYRHGLTGAVRVAGRPANATQPRQAIASAFALIPDDRKTLGAFVELSVRHNISLASLPRLQRFGIVDRPSENATVAALITRLAIKCGSPEMPLGSLSGGNQQKVVTAKWLAHGADIYLFCDPTRGVDAGAREAIYATIGELAAAGKAILVYSTDINEFAILCSRVLVFRGGRIAGTLTGPDIAEDNILAMSFKEQEAA